ncbi:MAG TPA: nucleotide exchange factor GrpE [Solirubrobacterales bacterium]|nr:nucleotide exchange factor GrpE [Solirubrobacterales bacterium]
MSLSQDEPRDEEFVEAATTGAEEAPVVEEAEVVDAPAGADHGEAEQATVEQDLSALVEEARNQRDEYLDLAQRTKADFDNYRKRMAAETASARVRGKIEVASGLIEAIDNLERVMAAEKIELDQALSGELPTDAPVSVQGVIVAYRDLNTTLRKAEIEVYDPSGEAFDPTFHEALQALPAEGVEPGVVIEVMQRGYRSGETVIRPARVVVSQ